MFVRDLLVSCNARDVGTMMFANSHKPLDRHRARLRPSLSAQRRLLGTRGLSRQPAWVGRTTSRVSCRWHWNPSWVCNPSRRCKKTRRERSLGHRSSVSVAAARIARARRRQAQDGRKGIGIIFCHFVPAFDLPFGPWSQKLDHIGASGIIVIRIPKWSPARSALAGLQRRTRSQVPSHFVTHWEQLFFTLRRSRGATGRYQGPTGARSTAPRRSRRQRTRPTPCPGSGKGF